MTESSKAIDELHWAWYHGNRSAFDQVLMSKPVPTPGETDLYGRTALWLAAAVGSLAGVRLLAPKSNLEFHCPATGHTPLHAAVVRRHAETARALLECGALPDARDHHSQTPLMLACLYGSVEFVDLLLEHHANVNLTDMNGRTALMMAVGRRRTAIARSLLSAGATVDTQDEAGVTALMVAPNLELVRLLLQRGADPERRDKNGQSVRDHMKDRPEVLSLLDKAS